MSHLLFDTPYTETPYTLLAYDEPAMIDNASRMLSGDLDALGMLTRISAIMGLGTRFTDTTHSGSMAEHQISHYIDMFAGSQHPGSSHGEQVGVGTITMSALQNELVARETAPVITPTVIPEAELHRRFGKDTATNMINETKKKAIDERMADELNSRFEREWPSIREQLRAVMVPYDELRQSMNDAGCAITASDLGLDGSFYRDAVTYARFIRDRFCVLDIVDDSIGLKRFVGAMEV